MNLIAKGRVKHWIVIMDTNHTRRFVEQDFVYEVKIAKSKSKTNDLHTYSQDGFWCRVAILDQHGSTTGELSVTDDNCEVIVYPTIEAAESGAKKFLSI